MRKDILIETRDGSAPASVFRPNSNAVRSNRGVLFYMDATGPRGALFNMAQRLADEGYVVLMPDLFYRFGSYGPFTGASFSQPALRAEILGMLRDTTQDMTRRDNVAFLDALRKAGATGPIGAVGYCLGGGRALTVAADFSDDVAAAASFHGGGLATEEPDSPHRRVGQIKGRVYVGIAGTDSSFPPEQSTRLAEALRVSQVDHIIENYVGMGHGWTVADHSTYNVIGAERHWKRLIELFDESFA